MGGVFEVAAIPSMMCQTVPPVYLPPFSFSHMQKQTQKLLGFCTPHMPSITMAHPPLTPTQRNVCAMKLWHYQNPIRGHGQPTLGRDRVGLQQLNNGVVQEEE